MKYALTILFIHISVLTSSQINYTTVPLDLQLVARDKITNLGNVKIEGNVDQSSGYGSIKIEVYRNEVLLNSVDNELTYIDSKAPFVFNLSIQAELANYSFKIYGYNSSNNIYELNKTVSNVVAGDAYIIQGQSNAVAMKRSGSANSNKSDFIRVYSSGTPNADSLLANDVWYIADGDGSSISNGNAGQWGLKLARLLVDNLGIPIAIFNGANGAQVITFFKAPQDYKTSPNSNYGRLYYRLKKTGLDNSVRAFFWSQGEANSGSNYISILNYKSTFKTIVNSYLKDYPNIEKFYIFQIKDMVCVDKTYEGKMNVKEAQRELASENEEIDIISTTSLSLYSDSCHFPFINGYESFANRLYKLVLQDIYNQSFTEEIRSPMIKSAEFTQPNTLILETDARELKFSSMDQTTLLTRLKQDFELKNAQNAIITNVNLLGNKIIFTLSGDPGPIANISFVGYNSNIGYTITNSSNLELICFRNFPIKNFSYNGGDSSNYPIIENTSICDVAGSVANIAVFIPNANASFKWLYKTPNGDWTVITNLNAGTIYSNYNSAILEIKKSSTLPVTGTLFRVVANYGLEGDFTSNEALLTVDAPPISKIVTGASTLCFGDSKTLAYGSDSVGTIQWQYSTSSSQENFIDIYEENGLTYTANNLEQTTWFRVMNSNGVCANDYSSTVQVVINSQPVAGYILGGNVNVCRTTNSTILRLNNYFGGIQWQKATTLTGTYFNIPFATSASYTASELTTTTYFRAVLSSGVCTSQITEPISIIVEQLAVSKTITGASAICAGESKTLRYGSGSVGTIQWQSSTSSSSTDFVDIDGENGLSYTAINLQQTTWFRVKNTSGVCSTVFSIAVQVVVNPKPLTDFISGGDVYVCKTNNSTILSLQNYVGEIQWQKATTLTGIYSNISSATSNIFLVSGLNSTTYYRAVLTSGTCTNYITEPVAINISLVAEAKSISGVSPICFGESKTLTYGAGSVGTIQWQCSTTSSTIGFSNIDNENGITYIANNLKQTTWFRVMNSIGSCSTVYSPAVQIVVSPNITPTFNQVAAICSGSSLMALPTTSLNSIIGKWSPALNNTSTTTYTFTPTSGGCFNTTNMTIAVNQKEIPTFTPVESICNGAALSALPTTSINGIIGTWSPALSNTVTKTYTFTPTNAVCTSNAAMTVNVKTTLPPSGDVIQIFNPKNTIYIKDLIVEGTDIRWYSSNENALTNTNPLEQLTIVTFGNTYYAMQTINGCSSTNPLAVKTYVNVNLGITDFDFKGLQFYPNPISDYFTIIYTERISTVELFNTIGQSVYIAHPNALKTTLNVNFLPSGVYYIEIKANNKKGLLKVIKK